jgi:hypothetical protein
MFLPVTVVRSLFYVICNVVFGAEQIKSYLLNMLKVYYFQWDDEDTNLRSQFNKVDFLSKLKFRYCSK